MGFGSNHRNRPADGHVELVIGSMTCASCANRVERRLRAFDGVSAWVNYATERARVELPEGVSIDELIEAVEAEGYRAAPADAVVDDAAAIRERRSQLLVAVLLSTPVVLLSLITPLQFDSWQWVSLTLAAPVVIWCGRTFHQVAWRQFRRGRATSDTLVCVASLAALSWSVGVLLWGTAGAPGVVQPFQVIAHDGPDGLLLAAGAAAVAGALAGRYLELRLKRRARIVLLSPEPDTGVRLRRSGDEKLVRADRLRPGDTFVVAPGETVAADGTVVDGSSATLPSAALSTAGPVEAGPGDRVYAGTANAGGRIIVRADRVGAETRQARCAHAVAEAQAGKTGPHRLADWTTGLLVPAAIAFTIGSLGYWAGREAPATAVAAAVATLVIAQPRVLGLSAPLAILAGTRRAARLGVLFRRPGALDAVRRIDTVVLVKTGVVTTGELKLLEVMAAPGEDPDDVVRLAGSVEAGADHPIGTAIRAGARARFDSMPDAAGVTVLEGLGVHGLVGEHDVLVGRPALLAERSYDLPDELAQAIVTAEANGATVVAVGWEGKVRGLLALGDTLRDTSVEAVRELKRLGLTPVLISGGGGTVAESVASRLGIDAANVVSEIEPNGEADVIEGLQTEGKRVAVLGDIRRDVAILGQADLGLALAGTDAGHAGDVLLLGSDPRAGAEAIRLGRRTLGTVRRNVAIVAGYHLVALSVAATGLINPLLACIGAPIVGVLVIGDSRRLRRAGGGSADSPSAHRPPTSASLRTDDSPERSGVSTMRTNSR